MKTFVKIIVALILIYVAYQAKWFDGAISYFSELSKRGPENTEYVDEYGNVTTVEQKSIYNRLKDMKQGSGE